MKVAVVTDGLFPDVIGGIQKYSYELVKGLAENGHEVHVYTQKECTEAQKLLQGFPNLSVRAIPNFQRVRLPWSYMYMTYTYSKAVIQLIYETEDPEIIYFQGLTGLYSTHLSAEQKNRIPQVHNLHGLEMFQATKGWKSRIVAFYLRIFASRLIKKTRYFVSLGEGLTKTIRRINAKAEVLNIPNGIGWSWFSAANKANQTPLKFLFVGREEWRKGLDTLEAAASQLTVAVPYEIHFVGEVSKLRGIPENIAVYHGPVREETALQDIYNQCHVLLCPSYSEGMPTVILEAMASGLFTIATNVGAVSDMIHENNGILLEPFDVDGLTNAMESCLNRGIGVLGQSAESIKEDAKKRFSWKMVTDSHVTAFHNIIVDSKGSKENVRD